MSEVEVDCMEIIVDDDEPNDKKEAPNSDEESIYECDFDINAVIATTLANLDVFSQIQDAISTTNNQVDVIENKFRDTSRMFVELDDRLRQINLASNNLKLILPRNPQNYGKPAGYTPKVESSPAKQKSSALPQPSLTKTTYFQGNQKAAGDSSLDVIPVARVNISKPSMLPKVGPLIRKELTCGSSVYAIRGNAYGVWYRAKILDIKVSATGEKQYKIKYDSKKQIPTMSGKQLAFIEVADVILPVGTRVIAQYKDEYYTQANSMYAGIVAEPPKEMNNYRYLIFFDDGYAQYVNHSETRVVCECSRDVWEDIHPDSKEFIRNYIVQYPERPMVKLLKGHIVKTEWNGKWWIAKVLEVDASLVKMYFQADKRTEWIYRGSTRLGPLYSELANAEAVRLSGKGSRRHNLVLAKKKSAPYVEYTRGSDEVIECSDAAVEDLNDEWNPEKKQVARKHTSQAIKPNVARKSTTPTPSPVKSTEPRFPKSYVEVDGVVEKRSFNSPYIRRQFVVHKCNISCLDNVNDDPALHKGHNPLTIPVLYGWERQIVRHKNVSKRVVFYRAPCGRRMRTMDEINSYLSVTKSKLTIDLFSTDCYVHVFSEFVPSTVLCYIKDISYGKENICVSGVNSLSREYPEYLEYSTKRIPNKGVDLNLDPDFLLCCDCEDNCIDPSKCACQQLTQEAAGCAPGEFKYRTAGYSFRRLKEPVITGIYECNQRCSCSSQCVNRVVQNGLQLRLQVFKTEKRGWGIRCLDDIPQGGFICIYAGQLLTEQGANEDGTQFGDEYLAELDYIEVVERVKEGYESDVVQSESESENGDPTPAKDSGSEGEDESKATIDDKEPESEDGWDDPKPSGEGNSSDSDFEVHLGPIAPRHRSTRIKKLVLRRETSDQDSNHSWNVHQDKSEDKSCSDMPSPDVLGKRAPNDKPRAKRSESQTSETSEESTSTSQSFSLPNLHTPKKASLSTEIDEHLKNFKLKRTPRVKKKLYSNSPINLDSGSEDDNNSKASKTSSSDPAVVDKKRENTSSRSQSRFWALPDPRTKSKSSQEAGLNPGETEKRGKHPTVRSFFGDEYCYIMDAKSLGNIGRYLNHNCSPNAFVQNVFVDTHDLRFPWVAFFALQYIRAGTELTWDYNYEVGSVPDKILYCYCGSSECRGRLL